MRSPWKTSDNVMLTSVEMFWKHQYDTFNTTKKQQKTLDANILFWRLGCKGHTACLIVCDTNIQPFSLSLHWTSLVLYPAPLTIDGRQVCTCLQPHPRLCFSHTGYLAEESWEMPVITLQNDVLCSQFVEIHYNISSVCRGPGLTNKQEWNL